MGDLSANFDKKEFECHCGCGANHVNADLVAALQSIRDDLDEPIHILSGVRCEHRNNKCGGAKRSQHLTGNAADIRIKSVSSIALYSYLNAHANKFGIGGLGLYIEQDFVHVDVRKESARWNG